MAILDRKKITKNAEKFVRQGKHKQALALYEQLSAASPTDMSLQNKVADLHVRLGQTAEACETLATIGSHYGEEGFYLKAIAIYKKINRLDPKNIECYITLGSLYSKQGLKHDAQNQFLHVADLHAKAGHDTEAAEALTQLVEVDPLARDWLGNLRRVGKLFQEASRAPGSEDKRK